jgi:N4-(beta-N-acetylglucosaminyl)-L-asparaginase
MKDDVTRRDFLVTGALAGAASTGLLPESVFAQGKAPSVIVKRATPAVVSSANGMRSRADGETCVERAFRMITSGDDVLDSLIAGVNIVELDPEDSSVGYGGLPNADGVVQLDSCCMHGPLKRAGGVAAIEGVRTPSLVARMVADLTDHHLLVGKGAQDFARVMGLTIEDDLNTERSRGRWLEWKRRMDPAHYPTAEDRRIRGRGNAPDTDDQALGPAAEEFLETHERGWRVAREMAEEGLLDPEHIYGTINCDGVNANGDVCGVTTTSGLAWKIPGRVGDSPILGAGLYVDGDVGAAGSTGRGEANLFGLCSFLVVEEMRRGRSPLDAGMEALRRVQANTIEARLLDEDGRPDFGLSFYILNREGEFAGVSMYPSRYAVCTENGGEVRETEALLTR